MKAANRRKLLPTGLGLTGALFLMLLLCLPGPLRAGSSEKAAKVVVADFDAFLVNGDLGRRVAEALRSRLAGAKGVRMIEMDETRKLLAGQSLSLSGVVSPEQAAETGRVLGADEVLVGSVGKLGLSLVVNARTVAVKSAMVTGGWSVTGRGEEDLAKMAAELADQIREHYAARGASTGQSVSLALPASVVQERRKSDSAPAASGGVDGYWVSEWYDGGGKHPGSIWLTSRGGKVEGWTVEEIGPAKMTGKLEGISIEGTYKAQYGEGSFEFSLAPDGERLIGSYQGSNGSRGTWMAWRAEPAPAGAAPGARVLADWTGDFWSYPATVDKIEGNRRYVRYDDGDAEWLPEGRIFNLEFEKGDTVYAAQEAQKNYIPATILEIEPQRLYVEYKDGRKAWVPVQRVRVLRVRRDGYW